MIRASCKSLRDQTQVGTLYPESGKVKMVWKAGRMIWLSYEFYREDIPGHPYDQRQFIRDRLLSLGVEDTANLDLVVDAQMSAIKALNILPKFSLAKWSI